jgi:hypothetical protein
MMDFILLFALFVFVPCYSTASDQADEWPADIARFIEQRDLCDHFRGEEPYDEERRKFLEKNIIELCSGTDSKLANLKEKYRENSVVIERLSVYEEDIEPNN